MFLKKYVWVAYLFLVFLGTFFLAKIASGIIDSKLRIQKNLEVDKISFVGEPERRKPAFEDYKIIMDRNIFDSREVEVQQAAPSTPGPTEVNLEGPAVKTSLSIKLVGTFAVGAGTDKRSSATIQGGTGAGTLETYTVGDEKQFAPGVKITKILPDRVEFINGPRLEYVEIEQFGGGLSTTQPISALEKPPVASAAPSSGAGVKQLEQGRFVVDRAELDQALSNLDQLFTQIRAVPQMGSDGKVTGLKLLSIRGGSIFAKLGLQRNDVLQRINGQDVDLKKGMEIFGQLKDASRVTIDLERGGKKTTLEYEIQ
jgi:general secretion pathway protein C